MLGVMATTTTRINEVGTVIRALKADKDRLERAGGYAVDSAGMLQIVEYINLMAERQRWVTKSTLGSQQDGYVEEALDFYEEGRRVVKEVEAVLNMRKGATVPAIPGMTLLDRPGSLAPDEGFKEAVSGAEAQAATPKPFEWYLTDLKSSGPPAPSLTLALRTPPSAQRVREEAFVEQRFRQEVQTAQDPAAAVTTPGPGKVQQPWLDPNGIAALVTTVFAGWGNVEQIKLQNQIAAQQAAGRRAQLPPPVARQVEKATFPWKWTGIGVAVLVLGGLVIWNARRKRT